MYLIAGLGNPGGAYKWTRHNCGFEVVAKLAFDHKIEIKNRKFKALLGKGVINGEQALLVMPQTFMNLSGESLRDLIGYFKIASERFIVVYDDTDLAIGDIRVRVQGSAGSHNGMKSVIYQLDTDVFTRVRVGIGQKPEGWDLADYVLSKFKEEERTDIINGITLAAQAVETILLEGADAAMGKYNKKQENKQ